MVQVAQVRHLSARGLTAAALHSELPAAEKEALTKGSFEERR